MADTIPDGLVPSKPSPIPAGSPFHVTGSCAAQKARHAAARQQNAACCDGQNRSRGTQPTISPAFVVIDDVAYNGA